MFRIEEVNNPNRVFGLDVFRAIAILIVIVGHANFFLVPYFSYEIGNSNLGNILRTAFTAFDGVDLFFVLSGFLIGGIILKQFLAKDKITLMDLKTFWFRRWLRTLPAYYFILIVNIVLLFSLIPLPEFSNSSLINYFFFLQNMIHGGIIFFSESWSLSVEEWFYLTFPVLFAVTCLVNPSVINRSRLFLVTCLVFITLILSYRIFKSIDYPMWNLAQWNNEFRTVTIARLDSILFGVFFAFIKYSKPVFFDSKKNLFLILGFLVLATNFYLGYVLNWTNKGRYMCTIYYSVLSFGMACFLPYAESVKKARYKFLAFFTFISIISYSLYLINYSIVLELSLKYLNPEGLMQRISCYIGFIIISIFGATILYKIIEKPVLNYRDRVVKA